MLDRRGFLGSLLAATGFPVFAWLKPKPKKNWTWKIETTGRVMWNPKYFPAARTSKVTFGPPEWNPEGIAWTIVGPPPAEKYVKDWSANLDPVVWNQLRPNG
jgi:hypothetical protein